MGPQVWREYARRFKRRQGRLGDIWHLDELFVTIQDERQRYYPRGVGVIGTEIRQESNSAEQPCADRFTDRFSIPLLCERERQV